jgi:tRNA nucleotidyltransferase (CCA-adding enzyme)
MRLNHIINESTVVLPRDRFEHLLTPAVLALDRAVRSAGYEVRIVGGAVRDLVMGKNPKDIDMASDAEPQTMMQILDRAGIRHEPTGLQHGTITAILDSEPIEITTLRIDAETDGRHAEVVFTNDWRRDAERRDLTFNAMSMELDGTLHDYFDGIQDLKNGVARFVGDADARMQEDYLRILRYFRFQGRIAQPNWDRDTMAAVQRNAAGLNKISGERVWMEMEKILGQPNSRAAVLEKMATSGVADAIHMPTNRINAVRQAAGPDPVAALAAAMNSTAELESVRSRWKFSTDVYLAAKFIVENREQANNEVAVRRMMTDPKIRTDHVFAMLMSVGDTSLHDRLKTWHPPAFPVTGADLVALGMAPGRQMGLTLADLRAQWEASGFKLTHQQLLGKVKHVQ